MRPRSVARPTGTARRAVLATLLAVFAFGCTDRTFAWWPAPTVSAGLDLPAERWDNVSGHPQLLTWPDRVRLGMNTAATQSVSLGSGATAYALRIIPGVEGPAYLAYQAGLGAFSQDFWPASTVKVLSTIAAVERLAVDYGFTGSAIVHYGLGGDFDGQSLRAAYGPAILVSSNSGYSRTLQVAGAGWINTSFFIPERGFPLSLLQRTYVAGAAYNAMSRPEISLDQNSATHVEPARTEVRLEPPVGCSTDGDVAREQNCMNLFEMIEGIRRVMLDAEVAEFEQFVMADEDLIAIQDDLCQASPETRYLAGAFDGALGGATRYCHKTGFVPGYHCLDHAYVEAGDGSRWLLAAATPYVSGCTSGLAPIGDALMAAILAGPVGAPLQPDAGDMTVRWTRSGDEVTFVVQATSGTSTEVWADAARTEYPTVTPTFARTLPADAEHLVVVRNLDAGVAKAYRSLIIPIAALSGCDQTLAAGPGCDQPVEPDGASPDDGGASEEDGGATPGDVGDLETPGGDNGAADGLSDESGVVDGDPRSPAQPSQFGAPLIGGCACRQTTTCPAWILVGLLAWSRRRTPGLG